MNDSIKIKGTVHITVKDYLGNIKFDKDLGENLVTNAGKAAIAGLVGNVGGVTAFIYLALGTSSTAVAVTDTTLGAEIVDTGLARVAATVSRTTTSVTNDTTQYTTTWTATGTKSIQECGIFNASSSGTLLAHKLTGSISVSNTDTLTLTYKVQYT